MDQDTLRSKLADYRRPAYLPICFRSESGPDRSKFGGVAWVNQGEAWPSCGYCARPLTLLLQLKLSELPMKVAGWPERGFAQVFYCTTQGTCCEQRGEDAFSPFGRFLCARLIEPGQSPAFDRDCPDEACLQAAVVWNWVEQDDYPTLTELQEIAPDFFLKEEWDRLRTEMQAELTIGKDKLGGWLVGPQGPRRPRCRECGARMQHIFQIASREHLGYNFGDCGTAHLFYCAVHPRVLGFSWEGC